jgi:hypothetical protein
MALYLVSYDIAKEDSDEYKPLWEKLEELGATKILFSEWLVKGKTGQASDLYSELAPLLMKKDRLLVQEVTKDAQFDRLLIKDSEFEKLLKSARV